MDRVQRKRKRLPAEEKFFIFEKGFVHIGVLILAKELNLSI